MGTDNYKKVMQVLLIILFANLGVAVLKIAIGILIKSASMTADGFHSLTDGASNIVGIIGIKFSSKPVDKEHPYGHGKFETLAGLFIASMLFFISGRIVFQAIGRFIRPVLPIIKPDSLILLVITLCINIFVCIYEYKMGRKLKSQILISDSIHTKSDIYVSVGVLVTLICIKLGLPPIIDPIVSLVVAIFILYAAYVIFKDNSNVLIDKAVVNTDRIREIVLGCDQVIDAYCIRSRGCERELYIDMHILIEANMSVEHSHKLVHSIEDKLRQEINENLQVIAHIEPFCAETEIE